ncbi:MAG: aminodeoxychorismate/anthranilate synthase component II [Bacteroidales bacterium]|jgi:anthranilate synthase component 2|nr:aminodeoxychorismate/anthranilate synthase component II [Bacteroidales bacterium]
MKVLIFDNYDSFTYNLAYLVQMLGFETDVRRNDQVELNQVGEYRKIILSPGPGIPSEARLLLPLIERYAPTKSILGVCLGHQAIAESFGGILMNLDNVYHGIASPVKIIGNDYLFNGLPSSFDAGRYHSWVVKNSPLPDEILVTALSDEGHVMALKHRHYDVHGVQFHPESILTPHGKTIIENFLLN